MKRASLVSGRQLEPLLQEAERSGVSADDVLLEFCMNALRLDNGYSAATFTGNTGLPATAMLAAGRRAAADGLLEIRDETIRCTGRGRRYLNDVLQYFMPASDDAARTG